MNSKENLNKNQNTGQKNNQQNQNKEQNNNQQNLNQNTGQNNNQQNLNQNTGQNNNQQNLNQNTGQSNNQQNQNTGQNNNQQNLNKEQNNNQQNLNQNTGQSNNQQNQNTGQSNNQQNQNTGQNNNQQNLNKNQNINQSQNQKNNTTPIPIDEKNINGKGVSQPPPKEIVSIGINIGAQNTIYSSFGKFEKNFISQVLLSDVSSRTIPSIIVYTDDHRLYGEPAKASIKRFYDSSYINLSRLIGFNPNSHFYNFEFNPDKNNLIFSYLGTAIKDKENHFTGKFYSYLKKKDNHTEEAKENTDIKKNKRKQSENEKKNEEHEIINADNILTDFLSLLHDFFFIQQKIKYDRITLSVPDYFTLFQRKRMKNILESIQDKEVIITTESTAITMYYGYTKYRDMFIKAKIGVDRNIKKNIVFIDIGYSKTSFIFSTFNYKEFKIKKVKCLPFLGGRNLDFIILKKLMDKFTKKPEVIESKKKRGISNILDPKSTYRLLESIEKTRKALTVNKDAMITVDSLYDEIDLEDEIKKEEFEQDIKDDFLNKFKKELESFLKDIRNSDKIDDIEMCGELVRTPILQDIVKELSKLDISKKILIDECPSVGAALFGYYINGNFPINTFEKIYEYNYYRFECEQELIPLKEKNIEELIKYEHSNQLYNNLDQDYFEEFEIQLTNKYFKQINQVKLKIKYKEKNDIKNFIDKLVIYEIEVKLQEIIKSNQKIKEDLLLKYQSNHEFIITLKDLIEKKNNKLEKGKNNINILKNYIYNEKEKEDKSKLKTKLQEHQNKDKDYMDFIERKNKISIRLYKYKTDINNLNNTDYSKEIIEIERALRNPKNVNEIEILQKRVDKLIDKTKEEIENKKKEDILKRKEELKKDLNKIMENCNNAELKNNINKLLSDIDNDENNENIKDIEDSYSKILLKKSLIDFNNEIDKINLFPKKNK